MTRFTPEEVRQAVATQRWRVNYDQFCTILDLLDDEYAEEKWSAFKDLDDSIRRLGLLLDCLLEDYAVGASLAFPARS